MECSTPPGLPQRCELGYVAERLNSVELNGSFYSLQRPSSYRGWAEAVPFDFVFAVKGGRFITHLKKLSDVDAPLANFFASGVLRLGTRPGPVLWQLPPTLTFEASRLADFLDRLPRSLGAAAALAEQHDGRLSVDRVLTSTDRLEQSMRHALEVRHDSFRAAACAEMLAERGIALVVADSPGTWPYLEQDTADFVYVRLHGHDELYASGYDDAALDVWAAKIRHWHSLGRGVYVYCDNDILVRAPFDAINLLDRVRDLN